jgi:nicotinamide-nucleotide amidase
VAKVIERFPDIKLGLRAKFPEIQVKLYLNTKNETRGHATLALAARWVADQLGDHVFSFHENTMAAETGELLKAHNATIAVAESCTGGLVGHWLTNTPGSSDYFLFSAVTYADEAKIRVLNVSADTLNQVGAVHEETAKQMAEGVRRLAGATYGVATTGIAGPSGGSVEKPVGTVCIGLAGPQVCLAKKVTVGFGRRLMNKQIFAMNALNLLRRHLLGTLAP